MGGYCVFKKNTMEKKKLELITKDDFYQAFREAYNGGLKNHAPLGSSGDTIILHDLKDDPDYEGNASRPAQVSLRRYNGDVELLITDIKGNFLFYGRYRISIDPMFIAEKYWEIFLDVKGLMFKDNETIKHSI